MVLMFFGKNRFIVKKNRGIGWWGGSLLVTSLVGFYTEYWQPGWMWRPKAFFLSGWSI